MTGARAAVFAALVIATFGAFFVAQRLKHQPPAIQSIQIETFGRSGLIFSPNGDGRRESVRIGFKVTAADHVTVTVLDAEGDPVRTLLSDHPVAAYHRLSDLRWDGRDDEGRLVPDGRYRIRITLRDQGRAFVVPRSILKDTKPARPRVASIGPSRRYGPEFLPLPGGRPATVRFASPARICPQVRVFRTAPGTPVEVLHEGLTPGARRWRWDGRLPVARPTPDRVICTPGGGADAPAPALRMATPGTYVVMIEWRTVAGNRGTSIPLDSRGLPRFTAARWPGNGGVTVRRIGIQAPVTPARAGSRFPVMVDARGGRWRWSLRRIGSDVVSARSRRAKTKPVVVLTAPGESSGLYLFTAATAKGASMTVPIPVAGRKTVAGTVGAPRGVLVVLPMIRWAGENPLDDDGDGAPNMLSHGNPSRLFRVSAQGLPEGFTSQEAPLLVWLDRGRHRFDVTTDVQMASGRGPDLSAYRGVLIPGDARWLPARARTALRRFTSAGGTVVSLGTDSLRRTVQLDERGRLVKPSRDRVVDLFGARLRPIVSGPTRLQLFKDDPAVDLFAGSDGSFAPIDAYEETAGLGSSKLLSSAVTVDPLGRTVIVAAQYGKGRVIRTGIPDFGRVLASSSDPAIGALMGRLWQLLAH